MKPSFLCLAACATLVTVTASAQSNVTVYGLVDMNIGVVDHAATGGGNQLRVNSGGMNTSRLGFRGSEELGGGMKASYQLEMGLAADTGVADNPLFKRQSTVGLEGGFGSVQIGRAFTTVYDFVLPYDPMGYAPSYSWVPSGNASGTSKYGMNTAFDNMVKYAGKAGNVSFGASYGAGEQAQAASGAKVALAASYAAGPGAVVATWERVNGNTVAANGTRDVNTVWHLGALVQAGALKLQAGLRDFRLAPALPGAADVRARLYWGGANYPVSPAVMLTGAIYYQDVRHAAAYANADPVLYVGRIRYALSRRTDLYAVAAYASARHGLPVSLARDEAGAGSSQRGVMAGIQHRF